MTHHAKEITKKPLKVATLTHLQQKNVHPIACKTTQIENTQPTC
jgi:hypothetical protein